MKTISAIAKIITALAAIAGVIYLIAAYGDKIVAWAKAVLPCVDTAQEETSAAEGVQVASEPVTASVEEPAEKPAESCAETAPVADESDFEG